MLLSGTASAAGLRYTPPSCVSRYGTCVEDAAQALVHAMMAWQLGILDGSFWF